MISLGGGAVTRKATRRLVTDRAFVVTLSGTPSALLARVGDVKGRPNLDVPDPLSRVRELLDERAEAYAETHESFDTTGRSALEVADAIVARGDRDALLMPLGTRSYVIDVVVDEPDAVARALEALAPSRVLVVTDTNVHHTRLSPLPSWLAACGERVSVLVLPPGEDAKTLDSVKRIWDAALTAGVDRDGLIVAFGGGVIGDLAGFAAATLLRGVRVLQVPTTLLAMVDSSVGGKTAFDLPLGKNLVGAFHQPARVVIDLAHLSSLPSRERAAGFAEVVKVGLVADAALFVALERDAERLTAGDPAALRHVVRQAVAAKIRVVRDDERENGLRAILNMGHTMGHALEAHGAFSRYLHGEAVAIGMVAELRAAVTLCGTSPALVDRTARLLARLGLPCRRASRGERESALRFLGTGQEKARSRAARFPVVQTVGEGVVRLVSLAAIGAALLD